MVIRTRLTGVCLRDMSAEGRAMQEPLETDLAAVLQVTVINYGRDLLPTTNLVNCIVCRVDQTYLVQLLRRGLSIWLDDHFRRIGNDLLLVLFMLCKLAFQSSLSFRWRF